MEQRWEGSGGVGWGGVGCLRAPTHSSDARVSVLRGSVIALPERRSVAVKYRALFNLMLQSLAGLLVS